VEVRTRSDGTTLYHLRSVEVSGAHTGDTRFGSSPYEGFRGQLEWDGDPWEARDSSQFAHSLGGEHGVSVA